MILWFSITRGKMKVFVYLGWGEVLNAILKVSEGFPFPKVGSNPLGERQGHFRKGKYPMKGLDTKAHW